MAVENTTREFWIQAPGKGEIRSGTLPACEDDAVQVRTLWSGISRGTEGLVFRGEVPPAEYETMRCPFQAGVFPAPVKYGYMNVGRVEAIGAAVDPTLLGRAVFCLYPHQDRYVVPAGSVTPIPDDVPPQRAVLAANLETAINGVWDAAISLGDRVVVVGAGVVGLLVAWLARRIPGTEVVLVDPDHRKSEVAEALDIPFTVTAPVGIEADIVVHASGHPEGLRDALELVAAHGSVVELSWFGNQEVSLPLGGHFHSGRVTLKSSQVGSLPPDRAPRWTHRRRLSLALELLRDPALDTLFSGESDFDQLPEIMERLASPGGHTLCHRIRFAADPSPGVG